MASTACGSAVEQNEGDHVAKRKRESFKWSDDMHTTLIECLRDYKVQCEFRGIDFDGDKTVQCEWLRKEMAKRHEENQSYFGPVALPNRLPEFFDEKEKKDYEQQLKEEKRQISRGHKRVLEKVKQIRQGGFILIQYDSISLACFTQCFHFSMLISKAYDRIQIISIN